MDALAPLAPASTRAVVEDSLGHLLRIIQPRGRFIYAHEAGNPGQVHEGYNMLRHCGTLWFMLRAINELGLKPTRVQQDALTEAVAYAGRRMERPLWVITDGPCFALNAKGAVKLGGIGLALVMLQEFQALARRDRLSPKGLPATLEETLRGLEAYALTQIEDGDFQHKRDFATGRLQDFHSDYYTGEVLLGLLRSPRLFPEANAVCERLMARGYGIDVQSHWMAYAACEGVERGRLSRAPALDYLHRLMTAIVGDENYRARRESTPIACRTEALTRFLLLSRARAFQGAIDPALLDAVRAAAEENLQLQLDWYADGQFRKGDGSGRVQIDYIQHNATAYLNWARWERQVA
ncbi:MAG TPA: hypothetical protein VM899_10225 [Rubellimicrobium sp.]|jgi:hypothetical protein|nr:hypothetical protein [Rubellimicrobium sp.]